jgi:hypothetical protein
VLAAYLCIESVLVWDLTNSLTASGLAAALLILDIGMLVLNRYILLGTTFKPLSVLKTLFKNFWPDLLKKVGHWLKKNFGCIIKAWQLLHFQVRIAKNRKSSWNNIIME